MITVLLVNYDAEELSVYGPLLIENDFQFHSASTMCEALNKLLDDKYWGVSINGDDFEYLSFLKVMRKLTPVPIGIAVSVHNANDHAEAIEKGATRYRARYDDPVYRVSGFCDMVRIYYEFTKWQEEGPPAIIFNDIEIKTDTRRVIVQDKEVALARLEFDILCYLIKNKGRVLTYGQIYSNVWSEDHADNSRSVLWWHISRLRRKFRTQAEISDFINTQRGVGYSIGR